ncbi:MAG: phosphoribosylglycinamide formyltransferase [Oscillospiraceae bacterium]|nr:phosphoribosylglycinamide formyltransferase [Oscillospiraceae bacterium]
MIRTAILVSGNGARLQTILDSMYFGEIPNYELAAVICTEANPYALRRCSNAKVQAIVVEPADFPTKMSYSMAIANKLRDMDIDLVVLAGYDMPLGFIAAQFKNRVIGVYPSLIPAFEGSGDPVAGVLERGCRLAGATSYFADQEGNVGAIIGQHAVEVMPEDTADSLRRRVMEEAEWKLLPKAIILYCQNRLEIQGDKVVIKE